MRLLLDDERTVAAGPAPILARNLSGLLRQAVEDAIAVEALRGRGYALEMGFWHEPINEISDDGAQVCLVCMAGAVMVKRLNANEQTRVAPSDFDEVTKNALFAIDAMRLGQFWDAADIIGVKGGMSAAGLAAIARARCLVEDNIRFEINRAPWTVYEEAAQILEEGGL